MMKEDDDGKKQYERGKTTISLAQALLDDLAAKGCVDRELEDKDDKAKSFEQRLGDDLDAKGCIGRASGEENNKAKSSTGALHDVLAAKGHVVRSATLGDIVRVARAVGNSEEAEGNNESSHFWRRHGAPSRRRGQNKTRIGLNPGDPSPGAYQVRGPRRGDPSRPELTITGAETGTGLTAEVTPVDSTDTASQQEPDQKQYSKRKFIFLLLGVLALIAIALGVSFALISSNNVASPASSPMTTNPCDFTNQEQPNVHAQCSCYGSVKVLSNDALVKYHALQADLGLTLPSPNVTSCKPDTLALLLVATTSNSPVSDELLINRYVLNLLFLSMNGEKWEHKDGWLASDDSCSCCFYGVTCEGDSVVGINLASNRIRGSLRSELCRLTSLNLLDLSRNVVTGSIPSDFGCFANLTALALGSNKMNGTVPSELGSLSKLTALQLFSNSLHGELPHEIWRLTDLQTFAVSGNQLEGKLPSDLEKFTKLVVFQVENNALFFNGTLPLWQVSTLTNLGVLDQMGITGTIPAHQLGRMTSLVSLSLKKNFLKGTLPSEVGLLTHLVELSVEANQLTGTIPTELGACSKLTLVYIGANNFTGSVPSELCAVRKFATLGIFVAPCKSKVSCSVPDCCTGCTD